MENLVLYISLVIPTLSLLLFKYNSSLQPQKSQSLIGWFCSAPIIKRRWIRPWCKVSSRSVLDGFLPPNKNLGRFIWTILFTKNLPVLCRRTPVLCTPMNGLTTWKGFLVCVRQRLACLWKSGDCLGVSRYDSQTKVGLGLSVRTCVNTYVRR